MPRTFNYNTTAIMMGFQPINIDNAKNITRDEMNIVQRLGLIGLSMESYTVEQDASFGDWVKAGVLKWNRLGNEFYFFS